MLTMENSHSITESWESAYSGSLASHSESTIFTESGKVRQEEGYACGPATLTSALRAIGIEADSVDLTARADQKLTEMGYNIEDVGVPPEVLKSLLDEHGVSFVEKVSDATFIDATELAKAKEWLEKRLTAGDVIIVPTQTTPEYWVKNRHTGKITQEAEATGTVRDSVTFAIQPNYRVVHTTTDSWTDRTQAPEVIARKSGKRFGVIPATTKDDVDWNGHYVLVVGMLESAGREFYVTVDPMYKWWQDDIKEIDPQYSGIRFIEKDVFMRKWHDRSGTDKQSYNQYGIAIPTNNS